MIPSSASKQGRTAAGRPIPKIPKAMNSPPCSRREFIRTSAVVAAAVAASARTRALPPGAAAPALAADDSLAVVKAYADTMLDRGRDVYGPVHSPLFATTLDRATHRIFAAEPPAIADIRSQDRPWQGGNPMHDQNLYQILYALSELTGETRYATEADRTLRWFLGNCQSAETGLLAWGEHCHWGFVAEQALAPIHEFYRPWVLWDRCHGLNPTASLRFARGLWDHQISNQTTGDFSRHANYERHEPGSGREFPRHGGYFIATWAHAYARTQDPEYLRAISVLADLFERHRDPVTQIVRSASVRPHFWVPNNLSLAIDLWDAAGKVPPDVAGKLRRSASATDTSVLALPHEPGPGGRGYAIRSRFPTFDKDLDYTETWKTSYGVSSDAGFAVQLLIRYRQNHDEAFRRLALQGADRYLRTDPQPGEAIYPGALGDILWILLDAHELTTDHRYLARADEIARLAMSTVMDDLSPLPKASSQSHHYEAVTRGDTLMMALLRLWTVQHGKTERARLVYTDVGV